MPEILSVRPADLVIDEENPRILQPNEGQSRALHAIADELKGKLVTHAADIAEWGLDPAALLIVEVIEGTPNRYRVLEGNRRVAALRVLENPELVAGSLTSTQMSKLRSLNKAYLENPIELVQCVVMTREEARHWIELRHTGENKGAGLVAWGSDESTRYQARIGGRSVPAHLQALEFLQRRGDLSGEVRRVVPATTFRRLIDTPAVRSRLGLDFDKGRLLLLAPPDRVAKALMHVIKDLVSGRINVGDVYHLPQREAYANGLPKSVVVKPTAAAGVPAVDGVSASQRPKKSARRKVRDHLIPPECVLSIPPGGRIAAIEHELRRELSLERHVNAVAVLFRVFVELSLDHFLDVHPIQGVDNDTKLRLKIEKVSLALEASKKLNKLQGRAIRSANNETSSLLPGTATMNGYIHNEHAFPAPSDLRSHWSSLQPLLTAIWT